MKRVLIISTSRSEQEVLTEYIQKSPSVLPPGFGEIQFYTTASFGQEAAWWVSQGPDCLLVVVPNDPDLEGHFIDKIKRDIPRGMPLLTVSEKVSSEMIQLSQFFERVRNIKSPLVPETTMKSMVEILTDWGTGQRQSHPRYATNQDVFVSGNSLQNKVSGKIKNLSKTGAYLELEGFEAEELKVQDLIKVYVVLGEPPKDYIFDAKIIWMKPLPENDHFGFGVNFLSKEEVYNQLLKGI